VGGLNEGRGADEKGEKDGSVAWDHRDGTKCAMDGRKWRLYFGVFSKLLFGWNKQQAPNAMARHYFNELRVQQFRGLMAVVSCGWFYMASSMLQPHCWHTRLPV
jgi:hypothetical protein